MIREKQTEAVTFYAGEKGVIASYSIKVYNIEKQADAEAAL